MRMKTEYIFQCGESTESQQKAEKCELCCKKKQNIPAELNRNERNVHILIYTLFKRLIQKNVLHRVGCVPY